MKSITKLIKEMFGDKHLRGLLILSAMASATMPLLIAADMLLFKNVAEGLQGALTKYLVFSLIYVAISLLLTLSNNCTGFIMVQSFYKKAFKKMLELDHEFFSNSSTAQLYNTLTSDVDIVGRTWPLLIHIVKMALMFIGGLVVIGVEINPIYSVVTIIVAIVFCLVVRSLNKKINEITASKRLAKKESHQVINNSIVNFQTIKIATQEDTMLNKFVETQRLLKSGKYKEVIFDILFELLITGFSYGLIFMPLVAGIINPSSLLLIYALVSKVTTPLLSIMESVPAIKECENSYSHYNELMGYQLKIADDEKSCELKAFENTISFKDVSFKYSTSDMVLGNVSVDIAKGQKVGLVGSSGCGKSTFVGLLPRFYDPTEGNIYIDGIDIKEIKLKSLRKLIGIVQQKPILFEGLSIYDNITFGLNVTQAEVVYAAKKVGSLKFIKNLPNKFDTLIGPSGINLSGGQIQLLVITRLYLQNPSILILDEATSALDVRSERRVKKALDELSKDKTVIAIAHRFDTLIGFDRVLLIENHTISKEGKIEEIRQLFDEDYDFDEDSDDDMSDDVSLYFANKETDFNNAETKRNGILSLLFSALK